MSDEYEVSPYTYSFFWPFCILLAALVIWSGYQDVTVFRLRQAYTAQYQATLQTAGSAQAWKTRYAQLMQDLVQTAGKDPYAASIAKEALQAGLQAGLIRVQPQNDTNSTANPAAPAAAK